MKKIIAVIFIFFILFVPNSYALDSYTSIEGEDFFNETVEDISSGNLSLTPKKIFEYIGDLLFDELSSLRPLIFSIIFIALISGILNIIGTENEKISSLAYFSCYCLMSISVIKLISASVGYGTEVINEMSDFVTKLAPLLTILLISSGYTASAAAFYPLFTSSIYTVCLIIQKCIVPMIYAGCVIGIANNLSKATSLDHLGGMIKSLTKWLLTASLTIFSGISAIYGFSTPSLDNIGIKTAKFAVGSIVPVVGGFLSESIETVLSGTRLMKNAVGTAGIISLLVICSVPMLKILAVLISLKITAALIEPVSDKKYADMIKEASDSIMMMFSSLLCVAVLFILSVAIIIGATNIT